jgi:hypothetical protein
MRDQRRYRGARPPVVDASSARRELRSLIGISARTSAHAVTPIRGRLRTIRTPRPPQASAAIAAGAIHRTGRERVQPEPPPGPPMASSTAHGIAGFSQAGSFQASAAPPLLATRPADRLSDTTPSRGLRASGTESHGTSQVRHGSDLRLGRPAGLRLTPSGTGPTPPPEHRPARPAIVRRPRRTGRFRCVPRPRRAAGPGR